jgi:hypothetical protein
MFTVTLYTFVTVIFRIIFTQNFQWSSSLHFLGLIDTDYAGGGLKTLLFLWCFSWQPWNLPYSVWFCPLYISFSICSPYTLCALYQQCEPLFWDLMSLHPNNNFLMMLCVAQMSDVSLSFRISTILFLMQLVL